MIRRSVGFRSLMALLVLGLTQAGAALAGEARNVIIFISDGAGFGAYNSASYYEHGRLGAQVYDQRGWHKYGSLTISTNTINDVAKKPAREGNRTYDAASIWVADSAFAMAIAGGVPFKSYASLLQSPTDSAAAGTALAAGSKTYNGAINYEVDDTDDVVPMHGRTIAEIAKAMGKSTGVVTSVQWSDATPATLGGAHNVLRGNKREIANEMLNSGTLDLIMGAAHPEYDNDGAPREPTRESDYDWVGGSFTWNLLVSGRHALGWKLVQSKAEFEALVSGPAPARVVGVPRIANTLQQRRQTRDWNKDGRVDDLDIRMAGPFKDPFVPTVPTLKTMTRAALNVLSRNPRGFYVMIEGGAVDWAEHANQPGRMIEEMVDFNSSVKAVEEWVGQHSNWDETLVIVTSDHETGLVWGLNSDKEPFDPIVDRGTHRMPGVSFNTGGHSNSLVPLLVRGAGSELFSAKVIGNDPVVGRFVDNTSIFEVMKAAMGGRLPAEPDDHGYYGGSNASATSHAANGSAKPAKAGDRNELLRND
ncbi:MAG: alkaline phosphatase [Tepidisphaerales bacterium]